MAAVAALCVQYEADFRPNMSIVVKALQPLLTARPAAQAGGGYQGEWTGFWCSQINDPILRLECANIFH